MKKLESLVGDFFVVVVGFVSVSVCVTRSRKKTELISLFGDLQVRFRVIGFFFARGLHVLVVEPRT